MQPEGPYGSQLPKMLHVRWLWAYFSPMWDGGLDRPVPLLVSPSEAAAAAAATHYHDPLTYTMV